MSISKDRIWMKYYPEESAKLEQPKKTAYAYLKESNAERLDHIALRYYGTEITYRTLFADIEQCAAAFAALGVQPGEVVSVLAVAVPECIAAMYALNKLGATANTMDPRQDKDSISRMTRESGSRFLVVMDVAFAKIEPVLSKMAQKKLVEISASRSLPALKKWVMQMKTRVHIPYGKNILTWDKFLTLGAGCTVGDAPYVGDRAFTLAHTGGTTGTPKAVMLTNDSVNAAAFNFLHCGLDAKPKDTFLGIIPVFTSYGVVCGMHMPLVMGFTLIPIPKFDPHKFGHLIRQFKPNHMISTPAFYEMMMQSPAVKNMDLSFIITMGSGGDTMNEGLEEKLHAFMKAHHIKYPLAQGYGMSEASAAVSFCVNSIYKKGSVGIPSLCTTVSIFDPDTGRELDYDQVGEVCMTGMTTMKGYYHQEEETAHILRRHEDGKIWIHSGDLGYMDRDGFLYIIGRSKRMITRFDGHKVYPYHLESMVCAMPQVRNCCVVGVKDQSHGQGDEPLVLVELAEGAESSATCRTIYEECQRRAEERGRPVAVLTMETIPLTGAGKNDFCRLSRQFHEYDYANWDPAVVGKL